MSNTFNELSSEKNYAFREFLKAISCRSKIFIVSLAKERIKHKSLFASPKNNLRKKDEKTTKTTKRFCEMTAEHCLIKNYRMVNRHYSSNISNCVPVA